MTFEKWGEDLEKRGREFAYLDIGIMYKDWKAERGKLIRALEKAEKLLMKVDDMGCVDANATALAYCGKCLSCQANDLLGEIDIVLVEVREQREEVGEKI